MSASDKQLVKLESYPNSRWTTTMLKKWEEEGFELPQEYKWAILPPGEGEFDNFKNWNSYFKSIERWQITLKEAYANDIYVYYNQVPMIVHAGFSMAHASKRLIVLDPNQFLKNKMDKRLWLHGVHPIVETARQPRNKLEVFFRNRLLAVYLSKMIEYFKYLIKVTEHEFKHFERLKDDPCPSSYIASLEEVDMLFRLLINVGDMYRYKYAMTQAYGFYEGARRLQRQNGRSYYQIAVLQTHWGKLCITMYHLVRALMSTISIGRAKDDILELHHKANKRHHAAQHLYWYALSKYREKNVKSHRGYRREIWIVPSATQRPKKLPPACIPPPNKKQHLAGLSQLEIFEKFSITMTLSWGMLFSRIGMDEFEHVAEECLVYFEGLLQRVGKEEKNCLDFKTVVEVVGLAIGTFEFAKKGKTKSISIDQEKYNLKMATLFMLEMFSIAVERLSKLIQLMDWDSQEIQYLSAAVMIWCLWLGNDVKNWAIPHVRARFAIRYIEKSRNFNRLDTKDDVWEAFGQLLSRIEIILKRGREYAFPKVSSLDGKNIFEHKISPFKEYTILIGFFPWLECSWYKDAIYTDKIHRENRAHLILRLAAIHKFGTEMLTDKWNYLTRVKSNGISKFTCGKKLIIPRDTKDTCGLYERNYWFWIQNFERNKQDGLKKIINRNRPDCNGSFITIRKKGSPLLATKVDFRRQNNLPISDTNSLWCIMDDRQFRSDMVVTARRIVLDTNCFIDKLPCIEKLMRVSPYPILLPITVVLELRGLSKGGLKLKYREQFKDLNTPEALEKLKQSNQVAISAKTALDFIESNVKYFRTVSTRGKISTIRSIFNRIVDPNFDPSHRNDNRILETCVYLEFADKSARQLETPMRLFRSTILLTNDKGMRVKSTIHQIPSREIESVVFWLDRSSKAKQ